MKNMVRFFGIITIVIIIGFIFTTCDNGTHTHSYSATWSSNVTQHWHECSCGDKKDIANHTDNPCAICGFNSGGNYQIYYEMVSIPSGYLAWGNAVITLSAFKMGKYEVTQELYEAVTDYNTSSFNGATGKEPIEGEVQGKRPVERVTWFDAIEFCNKLSEREGLTPVYTITGRTPSTMYPITSAAVSPNWTANGYRLPTEAQWEYACRAGTTTDWYFGSTESQLVNYAWYRANSSDRTHQVGLKLPNSWGLYDMNGNVDEWCWDLYGNLPATNQNDYKGAGSGDRRVRRGGCFDDDSPSNYFRSAYRGYNTPGSRFNSIGFRVVRP